MSFSALPRLTSLPEPSTISISREVKDVFDKSAKAVVKVRGTDEHGEFAGTGFFIDPIGTLYTAYSVAGEADSLTVDFSGKKQPARVLLADLRSGIDKSRGMSLCVTHFAPPSPQSSPLEQRERRALHAIVTKLLPP